VLKATSTTTAELLGQAREGDAGALTALYAELRRPIYLLAYAVLRSHALAEDAVQEAFVKVMEKAQSYRPTGSARAWVMRIAHNAAIDMLRRERRDAPLADEHAREDGDLGEAEERADFLAATRSLSDLDKAIVVMRVFADMPHAEVAASVGMTEVATRVRYHRILKRLRAFYEIRG
jgi:RNA polymerase sigma-70 factor (ECF subfamily)